jgi:hypothetical protein
MLCVDNMLDVVDDVHVIFRDSQCKFDDKYETSHYLEIVKYSMPVEVREGVCIYYFVFLLTRTQVCLNRPFINIIDQVSEHQLCKQQQHNYHETICTFVQLVCEREMYACADMLTDERMAAIGACVCCA